MTNAAESLQSSGVQYITGDATKPQGEGLKIIAHCNNNRGGWGSGFVVALSKKWPRPEIEYRDWHKRSGDDKFQKMLGATMLVPVESDIYVANIIGQDGLRKGPDGKAPVRYPAIGKGFEHIASFALEHPDKNVSIHMPRIGCGLAGGDWSEIEPLLDRFFVTKGIAVTVYDLP
jgi:O-acetyl-ADP-ribose deacetylase (regulator of RNase III)